MTARTLYFTGPRTVDVRTHPVPEPAPDEVRVRTLVSAISSGTEGLLYRGEAPSQLPADEELETIDGDLSYPLAYGYAAVGEVTAVGANVDDDWLERTVFAYHAHASHFVARPETLFPVPPDVSLRDATLFANLETAVTFLLDGEPRLGERAVVFGQGTVGLLTTALLGRTPLESLVAVEPHANRRERAESFGADVALDPADCDVGETVTELSGGRADLAYELSGDPDALDDAIGTVGFDGRVLVGSWYGTTAATLDLGGRFHRDRIEVRSSQVSTIEPRLSGRWTRERRHDLAWEWLERLEVDSLCTHEFPIDDAAAAYDLLEERPNEAIQVLLTYD